MFLFFNFQDRTLGTYLSQIRLSLTGFIEDSVVGGNAHKDGCNE